MIVFSKKGLSRYKNPKKQSIHNCYEIRNRNLSELGYSSYSEYLKSNDWKSIREDVLLEFPCCILCDRKSCQVHHTSYSYKVLLGLLPGCLVALCEKCHEYLEFTVKGEKIDLDWSNRKLISTARKNLKSLWLKKYASTVQSELQIINKHIKELNVKLKESKSNQPKNTVKECKRKIKILENERNYWKGMSGMVIPALRYIKEANKSTTII